MVAAIRPHSIPILIILVGLGAFAIGLTAMLFRGTPSIARAQPAIPSDCAQPSDPGCPLTLEAPAQAVLNDPTVAHNWVVDIPEGLDFTVAVANLPADLEVWVYGPDGVLLVQSNRSGYQDEIVRVSNVGAGTYQIVVDSPAGDWGTDPYTVLATTAEMLLNPPVDPYGRPTQFILAY